MNNRFYQLSFVIGLFFFIVSVILFINALLGDAGTGHVSLYTALAFFLFSLVMIFIKK